MASRSSSKPSNKVAVAQWLSRLPAVTEADWSALQAAFPAFTAATLRKAVLRCGLPLDAMVEGVRQDSFESLARTLTALQAEYEQADQAHDRGRMQAVRQRVIESKTHARFAVRRGRKERELMIEWILVWLNDPKLFDVWARIALRRSAGGGQRFAGEMAEPDSDQAKPDG